MGRATRRVLLTGNIQKTNAGGIYHCAMMRRTSGESGIGMKKQRSGKTAGGPRSRAGMQSYRIEAGKLVETWLILQPLGSAWPDAIAQEHWTSSPPIK
jgi:hypothetical protein